MVIFCVEHLSKQPAFESYILKKTMKYPSTRMEDRPEMARKK